MGHAKLLRAGPLLQQEQENDRHHAEVYVESRKLLNQRTSVVVVYNCESV